MATIKILEIWTANFPASPERSYTDKNGHPAKIEARPARTAHIALCEASDQTVNQIEIPEGYAETIKAGDTLQLTIPEWPDAPFRTRNITRHIKAAK